MFAFAVIANFMKIFLNSDVAKSNILRTRRTDTVNSILVNHLSHLFFLLLLLFLFFLFFSIRSNHLISICTAFCYDRGHSYRCGVRGGIHTYSDSSSYCIPTVFKLTFLPLPLFSSPSSFLHFLLPLLYIVHRHSCG